MSLELSEDEFESIVVDELDALPDEMVEGLENLVFVTEARPELAAMGAKKMEEAAKGLGQAIKAGIGVTAEVKVLGAGEVERSMGKAKRIVDLRPKA